MISLSIERELFSGIKFNRTREFLPHAIFIILANFYRNFLTPFISETRSLKRILILTYVNISASDFRQIEKISNYNIFKNKLNIFRITCVLPLFTLSPYAIKAAAILKIFSTYFAFFK